MTLTSFEWAYGIAQISAVFLSVVAGVIALSMFMIAKQQPLLRGWRYLVWALVLFAAEEIVGALRTFGIYESAYLTHVIPSFLLMILIAALANQININKGWYRD